MTINPFKILGISEHSSIAEIKIAHRALVKKYHPDAGGDKEKMLAINQAWEMLKDAEIRKTFSSKNKKYEASEKTFKSSKKQGSNTDKEISLWLKVVYQPIDKLVAEIINPFQEQVKELSADPYDDNLMKFFCNYIDKSQKKLKKIHDIYECMKTPAPLKQFSLSLYQCFSEMEDGINEWEIYSSGYIESYLHDGIEMLRKAKKQHLLLKKQRSHLSIL